MIILEISYKFLESAEFSAISFSQGSALLKETTAETRAGKVSNIDVTAYVPHLNAENDAIIQSLNIRPAIYRLKDASGYYHIIGSNAEPAKFTSTKKIGPNPGVAYGWDITITCNSTTGSQMQSFSS